jgi:hypothetical protein
MVRGLREGVNGLVLGWERYHGNKNIASRSAKVSAREEDDDNFLFSSCQKERFLKN